MDDLGSTIDRLLPLADPQGEVHARLTRLRGKVAENVMLGPQDRRFLQKLIQIAKDNIECKFLDHQGNCKLPQVGVCEHLERFKSCRYYLAQRGQTRGHPLSRL